METDSIHAIGTRAVDFLTHASYTKISLLAALSLAFVSFLGRKPSPKIANAPFHGYRSIFEPTLWLQIRFTIDAYNIITAAYKSVCPLYIHVPNIPYFV